MNFLDLKDIAERFMEIVNPSSAEKMLKVGEIAGLKAGGKSRSYSETVMRLFCITHSPSPYPPLTG